MDGRVALTAVALAALLAFAVFLAAAALEGILERTARALEGCRAPCALEPPPPEPPERQVARWLLAAAVAALEAVSIGSAARSTQQLPPAPQLQQRSPPARPPSSALSFSASSRACSLCASKLRRDRRQG